MEPSTHWNTGRVHGSLPDGTHRVEADRALRDEVLRTAPELGQVAAATRTWQARVVRHLAGEAGITQFLDLGTAPPPRESTHQVARRVSPGAAVVYAVPDRSAAEQAGALAAGDRTSFAAADPARPCEVLDDPAVHGHLDLSKPVGLLHCTTLQHVPDEQDPSAIMAEYAAGLAPGSHVAVAHWWDPEDEGVGSSLARRIEGIHRSSGAAASAHYRTRAEIEAMFGGLEFLRPLPEAPPGLAPLHRWWPDGTQAEDPPLIARLVLGGIARKP